MPNIRTALLNPRVQFKFTSTQIQPPVSATDVLVVGEQSVALRFVRNHRARRYVLRLRPDGTARITIPRGGSDVTAREFAAKNVDWLLRQLQRVAARPVGSVAWPVGSKIFFRGEAVRIGAGAEDDSNSITFADQTLCLTSLDHDHRPAVERHLYRLAVVELPPRVFHFAQQLRLVVERVTVRNQKTRWGSCSRRGTISLNWRLIQAPAWVADYIIMHELMHLRQMNHSRKFWQEVEHACPDFRKAEQWLKAHGRSLR